MKNREENLPNFSIERNAQLRGLRLVAGVDEAGRGPWAGPVVAAAVVLRGEADVAGLDQAPLAGVVPALAVEFDDVVLLA